MTDEGEGLLGGLLGDEEEGEESTSPSHTSLTPPQTPSIHPDVAEYYRRQTRLVAAQTEHLHEQRELVLAHLRVRRFLDLFKILVHIVGALFAVVLGAFLLVTVHDAVTSRAVVVEAFDAPPALAGGGLSGKTVAARLLDVLVKLQSTSRLAGSAPLSDAWSDDIRIEVPDTGLSVSDISGILKARFGHETHIEGDLVQTAAGVVLTVRGKGIVPKSFAGSLDGFDGLVQQAGEYVYGMAQPLDYMNYLISEARFADVIAVAHAALPNASPQDKPMILNAWANALSMSGGSLDDQLSLFRQAVALQPDIWAAWSNIMNTQWLMADEEGAWRTGQQMQRVAGGRPGRAPEQFYDNVDVLTWNLLPWRAAMLPPPNTAVAVSAISAEDTAIADIDVRLHDPADARLRLLTAVGSAGDPTVDAMKHFVTARLAQDAGDIPTAYAQAELFGKALHDPAVGSQYPGYGCWIAPIAEAAGNQAEADAVTAQGSHFVDCARFHADILDRRGDWPAAQRAYAAAIAVAPDLPAPYYSWGLALMRHGRLSEAEAALAAASQRGPHWADPLKASGDVLSQEGRPQAARRQYAAARQLAPEWTALANH